MNETTHRFLRTIVERVPEGRIAELRLFPAIRQGGVESAVAVVAVEHPEVALAPSEGTGEGEGSAPGNEEGGEGYAALDPSPEATELAEVEVSEETTDSAVEASADVPVAEIADLTAEPPVADALDVEVTRIVAAPFTVHAEGVVTLGEDEERGEERDGEREADVEVAVEPEAVAASSDVADDDDSPYRDEPPDESTSRATPSDVPVVIADASEPADTTAGEPEETIALGDILALPAREQPAEEVQKAEEDAHKRYAILTARYRLVLKGPDRGKWEVDITHEADAPLATVERVARGVARRAGDESDPEHFSGDALREAIERPSWATSA